MKKTLVSSLAALTAIAASTMIASAATAAKTSVGATYGETISWASGSTVIDVGSLGLVNFASSNLVDFKLESLSMDGSGKIEGVAWIRYLHGAGTVVTNITVDTNTTPPTTNTDVVTNDAGATGFSDFICDVVGKVGSKGSKGSSAATVSLAIKGSGYTSSTGSAPDLVVVADAKPSKLNLSFKSTGGVTTIGQDIFGDFTNNISGVPGTLNGTVNTGTKTLKTIKVNKETADLRVFTFSVTNLSMVCVEVGNKIYAASGGENLSVSWKGGTSASKATLNGKGVGFDRGVSLKLAGTPGTLSVTNGDTTVSIPNALATGISLSGKVFGQSVSATGGTGAAFDPGTIGGL